MSDIENIEEESRADRKSESPEEVNENILQDQLIGTTQPERQNLPAGQAGSQLQTENMEVHHPKERGCP
jgi:hypothetical protein